MPRYENNSSSQGLFLAINLDEQFSETSQEYIIKHYIQENIDIKIFDDAYNNDNVGRKIKNPKDIVAAVLYGYITGNRSSRKIEALLNNHIGFMYISNSLKADHSVICEFKIKFQKEIGDIFSHLLFILNEMNGIDWDMVVGDGTKIKAYANKSLTIGKDKTERILKTYNKLANKIVERDLTLEQDHQNGSIDDKKYNEEKSRILRQKRKYETIVNKIKQYTESDDVELKDKLKKENINITDPDSNIMTGSSRNQFIQGYNSTMMISNNDIILDYNPITDSEKSHTVAMVHRVEELKNKLEVHEQSKYLLDCGFQDMEQILKLQDEGIDMYVAVKERDFSDKSQKRRDFKIVRTESGYELLCKGSQTAKSCYNEKYNKLFFYYKKKNCMSCSYCDDCFRNIKNENNQKTIIFTQFEVLRRSDIDEYLEKINSEEGQKIYSRRIGKEHVFANIKTQKNFLQTFYRGLDKVKMDICWASLAHNILKYATQIA